MAALDMEALENETNTCGAKSKFNPTQIDQIMQAHRDARRRDGANQLDIVWDNELARRAQQWANQCIYAHGLITSCDGKFIGQSGHISGPYPKRYGTPNFESKVRAWAAERQNWDFEKNDCKPGTVCGHWTQLVWARTTKVGCGYANCEIGYDYQGEMVYNRTQMTFCDYSPPGNGVDETPFVKGDSCSACHILTRKLPDGPGYKCNNQSLCVPCSPAKDADCQCGSPGKCLQGKWNTMTCKCDCWPQWYGDACEKLCKDASQACNYWRDVMNFCASTGIFTAIQKICPKACGLC